MRNLNILFIFNSHILPIRDGVTAAAGGNFLCLGRTNNVFLLNLEDNLHYTLIDNKLEIVNDFHLIDIDIVFFSPLYTINSKLCNVYDSKIKVALISDCYSYVVWRYFFVAATMKFFKFSDLKFIFKLPIITLKERFLLQKVNYVMVQTEKDAQMLTLIHQIKKSKILVCPNGLQFNFENSSHSVRNKISLVVTIEEGGIYSRIVEWFFLKIWPHVDSNNEKITLRGKGVKEFLQNNSNNPIFKDAILDESLSLEDLYSNSKLIIAPIFKNYGLINKVIEGMGAGSIVLGDRTAFNGIPSIKHGENCYIFNSDAEFIFLLNKILNKPFNSNVGKNAQALITNYFNWSQTTQCLDKIISENK